MMVGQKILKEKLNNLSITTLPTPLLLVGEKGCGKHLFTSLIGDKLGLQIKDVTNQLNLEFISQVYVEVNPYIYLIDIDNITLREQNIILKWLEEPPIRSFIILIGCNINNILGTVQNRCQKWFFEPYSKEELTNINNNINDEVLELATTPGQLLNLINIDIEPIKQLVEKIITKISGAAIFNVLTIPDKIAFKNEKDKLNLDVFKKYLLICIKNKLKENQNLPLFYNEYYKIISNYLNNSYIPRVDQKMLLDKMLIELHEVKV